MEVSDSDNEADAGDVAHDVAALDDGKIGADHQFRKLVNATDALNGAEYTITVLKNGDTESTVSAHADDVVVVNVNHQLTSGTIDNGRMIFFRIACIRSDLQREFAAGYGIIRKTQMQSVSDTMSKIDQLVSGKTLDDIKNDEELIGYILDLAQDLSDAGNTLSYILSDLASISNVMSPYMDKLVNF